MMATQLDLLAEADTWLTGSAPREWRDGYTHLIRSAADPARTPRPTGGRGDKAPHRTMAKTPRAEWARRLRAWFAECGPATFNAACLAMLGVTADVAFTTPVNDALWDLVERGELEHSNDAPILFRARAP